MDRSDPVAFHQYSPVGRPGPHRRRPNYQTGSPGSHPTSPCKTPPRTRTILRDGRFRRETAIGYAARRPDAAGIASSLLHPPFGKGYVLCVSQSGPCAGFPFYFQNDQAGFDPSPSQARHWLNPAKRSLALALSSSLAKGLKSTRR